MHKPASADEATNTLLLTAPPADASRGSCLDHFGPTAHHPSRALLVTYPGRRPPQQWCRDWEQRAGERSAHPRIVRVGDFSRSATSADQELSLPEPPPAETASDPVELMALGITINDLLTDWSADDQSPGAGGTVVCFDSVTALLEHVDLQATFRFLHVLLGRLSATGATTHPNLDPAATDDEVVRTLRQLFGATVDTTDH